MRYVHGLLLCLGVAALSSMPATAQVVSGNITFTATPDSATSLATPLIDFGTSTRAGLVSSASVAFLTETNTRATITFSGSAGLYNGATGGVAVAPQLAGTTLGSNYLAAQPNGNVTITYAAPQTFFGVNWGSVDAYNTLSFYNNGIRVASLTGSQVLSSSGFGASTVNVAVNFNTGTSFTSVVAQSTSPAFEFGLIRSSAARVAPSPMAGSTPLGAVFAGLLLWLCMRRRNASRNAG